MTIEETIVRARELAQLSRLTFPENAKGQDDLALWLEELLRYRSMNVGVIGNGISICIVTYNVLFYNKLVVQQVRKLTRLVPYELIFFDQGSTDGSVEWLSQQEDVILVKNPYGKQLRHGSALDYLLHNTVRYPITCSLCCDAFPTSPEWLMPAMHLDDDILLSGVEHGYGRVDGPYVSPSYMFGWTDWLKKHSFEDRWPQSDTGESLTRDCISEGKQIKLIGKQDVKLDDRFTPKPNDYSGLVWHTWWSVRVQSVPQVIGSEVEPNYHEFMMDFLRKKHNLDF